MSGDPVEARLAGPRMAPARSAPTRARAAPGKTVGKPPFPSGPVSERADGRAAPPETPLPAHPAGGRARAIGGGSPSGIAGRA